MPAPSRKLHRAHFGLMRALAQCLDLGDSWTRHLEESRERDDLRTIRSTEPRVGGAFAAAAT